MGVGGGEIILIFMVILIFFGSKQIPEFAKMLGKGMNEFRKATDEIKRQISEETKDFKDDVDDVKKNLNG
jgi:sec-independent protein translocase protein TatA